MPPLLLQSTRTSRDDEGYVVQGVGSGAGELFDASAQNRCVALPDGRLFVVYLQTLNYSYALSQNPSTSSEKMVACFASPGEPPTVTAPSILHTFEVDYMSDQNEIGAPGLIDDTTVYFTYKQGESTTNKVWFFAVDVSGSTPVLVAPPQDISLLDADCEATQTGIFRVGPTRFVVPGRPLWRFADYSAGTLTLTGATADYQTWSIATHATYKDVVTRAFDIASGKGCGIAYRGKVFGFAVDSTAQTITFGTGYEPLNDFQAYWTGSVTSIGDGSFAVTGGPWPIPSVDTKMLLYKVVVGAAGEIDTGASELLHECVIVTDYYVGPITGWGELSYQYAFNNCRWTGVSDGSNHAFVASIYNDSSPRYDAGTIVDAKFGGADVQYLADPALGATGMWSDGYQGWIDAQITADGVWVVSSYNAPASLDADWYALWPDQDYYPAMSYVAFVPFTTAVEETTPGELVTGSDFDVNYKYIVTDFLTDVLLAEIPFKGVSYERKIRKAGTFTGSINVVPETYDLDLPWTTMPGRTALYVVRNDQVIWGGIIWNRGYDSESKTLTVTGLEFTSYLYFRTIWVTLNYATTVDSFDLVRDLFGKMKTDFSEIAQPTSGAVPHPEAADPLFELPTNDLGRDQDLQELRGFRLQYIGEFMERYSDNIGGFEYRIDCSFDGTRFHRKLVVADPGPTGATDNNALLGRSKEFGTSTYIFESPGNVAKYTYDESASDAATRYWMVGGDANETVEDDTKPRASYTSTAYLDAGWPLIEQVDTSSHRNAALPTTLANYAARDGSRQVPPVQDITVTVNGSLDPQVGTYVVGDWCSIFIDDDFVQARRIAIGDEETSLFIKRIAGYKVTVPDVPTYPEMVELELMSELEVEVQQESGGGSE